MSKSWNGVVFLLAALATMMILVGCSTSAATASCAFVVGDGVNGNDAKLHYIIYPGQSVPSAHPGENVSYVPCNSRNYIINNGTVKNANGQIVGDRGTLISATTSTGVPIQIAARALWTLNESDTSMRDFYNVCYKYACASDKDERSQSGDVNFSTPGWNGMLAENFGPAMDTAAREAAFKADDAIWKNHDPAQYKILGDNMAIAFMDAVRANLGYPEDLFCGSGNSTWPVPTNPGEGEFTCSPVRIVIDSVDRGQIQADESTEGVKAINTQRLENAQALYGPDASYWLGLQDSIDRCKSAGVTCIVNIGGTSGGPAVTIPAENGPLPVPSATPAKK